MDAKHILELLRLMASLLAFVRKVTADDAAVAAIVAEARANNLPIDANAVREQVEKMKDAQRRLEAMIGGVDAGSGA